MRFMTSALPQTRLKRHAREGAPFPILLQYLQLIKREKFVNLSVY
jgi:hypothetical protein